MAEEGAVDHRRIVVRPLSGDPYVATIPEAIGGHGGGDAVLLKDLFGKPKKDRFNRAASHIDGALSILTGIAANRSMETRRPVQVDELVTF